MQLLDGESGFLEALARDPADEALRAVYADWLEERGDPRAEWLRLEAELAAVQEELATDVLPDGPSESSEVPPSEPFPPPIEDEARLKRRVVEVREALAAVGPVDPAWTAAVVRLPIENCDVWSRLVRLRYRCPERWEKLAPTVTDGVRFCGACRRHVFLCDDLESAVTHARAGNRVAVAPNLPREPGDLDAVEMMLGELEQATGEEGALDRRVARPFVHVFQALQRVLFPGDGPPVRDNVALEEDSARRDEDQTVDERHE